MGKSIKMSKNDEICTNDRFPPAATIPVRQSYSEPSRIGFPAESIRIKHLPILVAEGDKVKMQTRQKFNMKAAAVMP